jgi:hypothetical protein
MNRKAYGILLVLTFLAVGFLTSCSSNSGSIIVPTTPYAFYLSGTEAINDGPNFYALAGAVNIDPLGNVKSGEQDYNDGFGVTSPEPAGDTITGGSLTVNASGQGTLTLITSNAALGVNGTETLGVQFVNDNHALIVQFDGSATSSGSMDLQTLPSTPSGGFAFTLSGVNSFYDPAAFGGVFTIGGSGTVDINDADAGVLTGTAFTPVLSTPDSFGRGTISGGEDASGSPLTLNYYVVGAEAIRIIDVDATESAVGSAFGQGTNATAASNAAVGSSVLAIAGNPWTGENAALGQFTTTNTGADPADFSGVAEDNELGNGILTDLATAINGTYSIAANGYGTLTVGSDNLGNVFGLGVYLTDPTLNINDPNNSSGGGGALVLDLDDVLSGTTGILVPQTDTTVTDFAGNYAAGWQNYNNFSEDCSLCETDMISQGTVTDGAVSLTGLVSDPFATLTPAITSTGNTFTTTPLADSLNVGRYSMLNQNATPNPIAATIDEEPGTFDAVMYQASGGQLFWLEWDTGSVFLGPLEQQPTSLTLPAAVGPVAKPQTKQKPQQ